MSHFHEERPLSPIAPGHWVSQVSPQWSIGANPNGGYLLALALKALGAELPQPHPVSIAAHYLRPGEGAAPCDCFVEVLKVGKQLATGQVRLEQEGKTRLAVLATYGTLPTDAPAPADRQPQAPDLPDPEACVYREAAGQGVTLPIAERLDVRLNPAQAAPGQAGEAAISGWIRFRDGTDPDPEALALFCDAFPPSVFGLLGAVGWVPTVSLNVELRRYPTPGWIAGAFSSRDQQGDRMLESGGLWDSRGALVASVRQLGLVRRA
jgi:acyl-CoA thioesterase